jgi:hypothetical protein
MKDAVCYIDNNNKGNNWMCKPYLNFIEKSKLVSKLSHDNKIVGKDFHVISHWGFWTKSYLSKLLTKDITNLSNDTNVSVTIEKN